LPNICPAFAEYKGLHRLSRVHSFGNVGQVRDVRSKIYKNCARSFFTALHWMQHALWQTRALWQNGKKDRSRFLYNTKDPL